MKIKNEEVKKLIFNNFNGNMAAFAREIKVDYSYCNSVLNGKKSNTSKKMCEGIIKYCKLNNLNYQKYIFF